MNFQFICDHDIAFLHNQLCQKISLDEKIDLLKDPVLPKILCGLKVTSYYMKMILYE